MAQGMLMAQGMHAPAQLITWLLITCRLGRSAAGHWPICRVTNWLSHQRLIPTKRPSWASYYTQCVTKWHMWC